MANRSGDLERDQSALDLRSRPDTRPADPAWWKTQESLQFVPQAICDGKTVWVYNYKPKAPTDDPGSPAEVESVSTNASGFRAQDDPIMPWSHLQPEQLGHPNVGLSAANWQFFLDTHPTDGPPDTVRLRSAAVSSATPISPTATASGSTRRRTISLFEPRSSCTSRAKCRGPATQTGPAGQSRSTTSRPGSSRTLRDRRTASGIPGGFSGRIPRPRSIKSAGLPSTSTPQFLTSFSDETLDSTGRFCWR